MSKIFDVTLRVRVVANDEQQAHQLAVKEMELLQADGDGHVPLSAVLDSHVNVEEFCGKDSELPILKAGP